GKERRGRARRGASGTAHRGAAKPATRAPPRKVTRAKKANKEKANSSGSKPSDARLRSGALLALGAGGGFRAHVDPRFLDGVFQLDLSLRLGSRWLLRADAWASTPHTQHARVVDVDLSVRTTTDRK